MTYRSSGGPRRSFTPQPSGPGFAPLPESAAGRQESGNFPDPCRAARGFGLSAAVGGGVNLSGPRAKLHKVSNEAPSVGGKGRFRPGAFCLWGVLGRPEVLGTAWVRDGYGTDPEGP